MSDDVIDLGQRRTEREQRDGEALHARGLAFAFRPYVYQEVDGDDGIGLIEGTEFEVCMMLAPQALEGLCMTRESALELARALHGAATADATASVPQLSEEVVAALDPDIRYLVLFLRSHGFETTDSGDGKTKTEAIAEGEALDYPHVFAVTTRAALLDEADRMQAELDDRRPGEWTVEASYSPGGAALLLVRPA